MPSLSASQLLTQLKNVSQVTQQGESLKQGQIVGGKVLKLYPQQKALIQIGGKQLNAQLEASLSANERYVFQVQSISPLLRLKVMEGEKGKALQTPTQYFKKLGISSPSKTQLDFVSNLMQKDIPFTNQDVKEALQLLEKSGGEVKVRETLLEMMSRRLPIKSSIFQAFYERNASSSSLTSALQSIANDLKNQNGQQKSSLGYQLQQILGRSDPERPLSDVVRGTFLNGTQGEQKTSFQLLQRAGLISEELSFNQVERHSSLVFKTESSGKWAEQLLNVFQEQLSMSKGNKQLIHQFTNVLERMTGGEESNPVDTKLAQRLTQLTSALKDAGVFGSLRAMLNRTGASPSTIQAINTLIESSNPLQVLKENPSGLQQAAKSLTHLMNQQLNGEETVKLVEWLRHSLTEVGERSLPMKDEFLIKLKSFTQLSGLNYEHQLAQKGEVSQSTLKGSILQAMQDSASSPIMDRLQTVLNHLNAVPIMMQESDQSIHFNVQMPGEWFGIEQDVTMDVDGNKKENGEIDPDYCHILFYLELQSLKETIIDMKVQKRVVQLTLFTENQEIENVIQAFKPSLEKGLLELNYHLSTVRHKEIKPSQPVYAQSERQQAQTRQKGGFDLKI